MTSNGYLSFVVTPDFEDKSSYIVSIVAADDKSLPGSLDARVAIVNVNEEPEILSGGDILTYNENTDTSTELYFYSAIDPENNDITWSLSGTDSGDFEIGSNGVLIFTNSPDYERPADSGGNNVYNVTVRASDGSLTGTKDVTATVTDVNEAPSEPTGRDTITVAENTTSNLARYSTTDPERATIEWSVTGNDSSAFRIDSSGNLAFDGAPDYEAPTDTDGNNIYNIAITATDDGTLGDRTASHLGILFSSFDVTVKVTPIDEPPVITGTTTFDNWQENDSNDIHSYSATDPEGDTNITWSLAGADRGDFTITSGELKFASTPDYERPADSGRDNHYDVTVVATDSNNKRGEQHVDVIVKNVDEPPEITGPETVDDFPENASTSRQVARYTATDPEGATVTLSLSSGGAYFTLASNGTVTFKESPDFEEQNVYSVTVRAVAGSHTEIKTSERQHPERRGTGNGNAVGLAAPGRHSAVRCVGRRRRTHRDHMAVVSCLQQRQQRYGHRRRNLRRSTRPWIPPRWAFTCGSSPPTTTAMATTRVPPPSAPTGCSKAPPQPEPPVFPVGGDYDRSIRENTRAGTNLGAPVTATDGNNDRLTYSIGTSNYFEIVDSTGQLRTKVELDHETGPMRSVTVTATDPGNLTDTVAVTITVDDVDETPVVSGPTNLEFEEDTSTSTTLATYMSTNPDRKGIGWELTGTDSEDFTLSSGGVLTFNAFPDFEEPADSGGNNDYRVTVEAHEQGDGTSIARLSVTVRVTNVDEPGMVVVPVNEPRVGQQLTPTVVDPDEGVGSIEWKWEHREAGRDWTPIPGGTSRSYTPTRDDNGKDLRVTAFYRDRHGPGKTYTHEFVNAVVLRPYFDSDTSTRTIRENSPGGQSVGGRFTARHPDNVNLTYTVGGADAIYFTIDSTSGHLKTSTTPLDYEGQPGAEADVEVTAEDSNGQTATNAVTVTVTDECTSVGEPPCAPSVSSSSATSLRVSWSAPSADSHHLRHREADGSPGWTNVLDIGSSRSYTITQLTTDTTYEVQVRTVNGVNSSDWSPSGTGTPKTPPPPPPPPTHRLSLHRLSLQPRPAVVAGAVVVGAASPRQRLRVLPLRCGPSIRFPAVRAGSVSAAIGQRNAGQGLEVDPLVSSVAVL